MIRTAVFIAIASLASVAQADAPSHFAPTELGIIYHPNVSVPGLTREQVAAELAAAQRRPDWDVVSKIGERPAGPPLAVNAKSRAEVVEELRAAQAQQGWNEFSRLGYDYPELPKRVNRAGSAMGR